MLRRLQFFNIFTSKCAFRHSGVQFFDIRTSKSAPKTTVFQHFHCQMCFSPQRRTIIRHQNVQKCSEDYSFFNIFTSECAFRHSGVQLLDIRTSKSAPKTPVFEHFHPFATAACIFSTAARPKVVQTRHVLKILTSKCAFRHSRVHFFNISTYKSGPNTSCFEHFHFQMCFSPQPRTIFPHLHVKKWSENEVFCTFSLRNVLFATAACNF